MRKKKKGYFDDMKINTYSSYTLSFIQHNEGVVWFMHFYTFFLSIRIFKKYKQRY